MRELIKPTLFIIARTGLFLSVAAWIVGQCWTLQLDANYVIGGPAAKAWVAGLTGRPIGFNYHVLSNSSLPPGSGNEFTEWPITFSRERRWVSVQHWFLCAIFAAFSIFLHFIYRKRPEVQPCEN